MSRIDQVCGEGTENVIYSNDFLDWYENEKGLSINELGAWMIAATETTDPLFSKEFNDSIIEDRNYCRQKVRNAVKMYHEEKGMMTA